MPWLKKVVSKVAVDGGPTMRSGLLDWDHGAISVKATCAALYVVLFFSMSSTENKERLCCSRESPSDKKIKTGLLTRQ